MKGRLCIFEQLKFLKQFVECHCKILHKNFYDTGIVWYSRSRVTTVTTPIII